MRLRTIEPQPPLDGHVEELVHYTHYRPAHTVQRMVPDGCAYLVFELDGMPLRVYDDTTLAPIATFGGVWFSGPHQTYRTIEARVDSSMFVVRFRPGGAFGVVGGSLAPYADRIVDAEGVFGPEVSALRDGLVDRPADVAFARAAAWLGARCDGGPGLDPIVRDAVDGIRGDAAFDRTNPTAFLRDAVDDRTNFFPLA